MKFYNKPTLRLKKKDILGIVKLKNSHWNFGISSQLSWFKNKKNVFKNDFHLFFKNLLKLYDFTYI